LKEYGAKVDMDSPNKNAYSAFHKAGFYSCPVKAGTFFKRGGH